MSFVNYGDVERFNPRTRKGCDPAVDCRYINTEVSIHAPVKDATYNKLSALAKLNVSIHAPVKDATQSSSRFTSYFHVSIHAPVKDATECLLYTLSVFFSFNPRTRKGCDSMHLHL